MELLGQHRLVQCCQFDHVQLECSSDSGGGESCDTSTSSTEGGAIRVFCVTQPSYYFDESVEDVGRGSDASGHVNQNIEYVFLFIIVNYLI